MQRHSSARTFPRAFTWAAACLFIAGSANAQQRRSAADQIAFDQLPSAPEAQQSQAGPVNDAAEPSATVNGIVLDPAGAAIDGALVMLTPQQTTSPQAHETHTDSSGSFSISGLLPGPFILRIVAPGFANQEIRGVLQTGETYHVPELRLAVAGTSTDVQVTYSAYEAAQEQIQAEEKQRVFGAIPNFYVSYDAYAEPLTAGQKFHLAERTLIDPASFIITGVIAGVQQANNTFPGYGQGAQGYGKRYGAGFGSFATSLMIGNAILPSLLKQDPRYFYQGTGSIRSRALHAMERSVICRGDNGHKQFDYSGILGGLAAGGISSFYYPAEDRNGAALTFQNAGIGIAISAAETLFQEFLVRKLSTGAGPRP